MNSIHFQIDINHISPKKMKMKSTQKERVIQCCIGWLHTLILTQRGNVYSMGKNDHGQLGLGHYKSKPVPSCIDSKYFNHEKIIQICCGSSHCMALTQNGNVYSWGYNEYGQLGDGNNINQNTPQKINFNDEKIKSISTGPYFSFALTINNKLFAFGINKWSQLGLNHDIHQFTPTLIDSNTYNNEQIINIACGGDHTLLLTQKQGSNDSSNLYSCGYNDHGQLGLGHNEDKNTFQLIDLNHFNHEKIKNISSNGYFSMAITEKNGNDKLYSWGHNYYGQLGLNDTKYRNLPCQIDFKNDQIQIKHIGNASYHSFAIIKEQGYKKSKIYAWGENKKGQLGVGYFNKILEPILMKMNCFQSHEIISIGGNCGIYSHSFAISKTGKLFTWGYNLYGQLGLNHCNKVNHPQLCYPDLFGIEKTNEKTYKNKALEDVIIEFD